MTLADQARSRVRDEYRKAATGASREACCADDYSEDEKARIPAESLLGLGSGNPVRAASLRPGETVVDLGSGAGVDVFLAASLVGPYGKAVGVDMTPEMLARAREAAEHRGVRNVEFLERFIEDLPLPGASADVVVSNCVINLSPDKPAVFREAFRVLRPGGRLVISDIVQESPLGPVDDDCGCVANAMLRKDYLATIRSAGFEVPTILEDRPWREGPSGVEASSITLRAVKPREASA